jgi:hypothetical protein
VAIQESHAAQRDALAAKEEEIAALSLEAERLKKN